MTEETADGEFLLAVLNSTPLVNGAPVDRLADAATAEAWLHDVGGAGSAEELRHLVRVRTLLQSVVRGQRAPEDVAVELDGVVQVPGLDGGRVVWTLGAPPGRSRSVRAVLAWATASEDSTGRVRPCANPACRRFLLDRTRANSARWCSMAVCGNRMKARRHSARARAAAES